MCPAVEDSLLDQPLCECPNHVTRKPADRSAIEVGKYIRHPVIFANSSVAG
jgi:hypothetical protein